MATEYVDAGTAVDNSSLSGIVGSAPPVTNDVTYERILNARSEPQNWLTYYGAYDGQRYSPLDQINKGNVKQLTPAWVFQCGSVGAPPSPPLSSRTWSSSGAPAGSSAFAATSTRSSARPASACGGRTWCRSPASPAPRPGRQTERPGRE